MTIVTYFKDIEITREKKKKNKFTHLRKDLGRAAN